MTNWTDKSPCEICNWHVPPVPLMGGDCGIPEGDEYVCPIQAVHIVKQLRKEIGGK